jgi:hypothetical protein|tara:strand:- start:11317 stop:11736 length:420 start_codon:yes stop_codon:yes gene_type:complete
MVRLTTGRIRRMQAAGQRPPPVPKKNNNDVNKITNNIKRLLANYIQIKRNSPNLLPNINKTNVATFYNNSFSNTEAKNIPKNKRVYISKDLVNGRVKQVYNQDGIIKLLSRSPGNNSFVAKSPISRKNFEIKHVIPYLD